MLPSNRKHVGFPVLLLNHSVKDDRLKLPDELDEFLTSQATLHSRKQLHLDSLAGRERDSRAGNIKSYLPINPDPDVALRKFGYLRSFAPSSEVCSIACAGFDRLEQACAECAAKMHLKPNLPNK